MNRSKTRALMTLAAGLAIASVQAQTPPSLETLQPQLNELRTSVPTYYDATGKAVGVAVEGGVLVRIGRQRYLISLTKPASLTAPNQRKAYVKHTDLGFDYTTCLSDPHVLVQDLTTVTGPKFAPMLPPGVRGAYLFVEPDGSKRMYTEVTETPVRTRMYQHQVQLESGEFHCTVEDGSDPRTGYYLPLSPLVLLSAILTEPLTLR
jgi:hypothetical protein